MRTASEDRAAIEQGKVIVTAITPLISKRQIDPYRRLGYFIDPNWVKNRSHLYLVFMNPITGCIDATTSYNSPEQPPRLVFPMPGDTVHKRDIEAVVNQGKRAAYKTVTCIVEGLDLKLLAEAIQYFRECTKNGLISLYDGEGLEPRGEKDCQIGTLDVFRKAFPAEVLPIPAKTFLTRLAKQHLELFRIADSILPKNSTHVMLERTSMSAPQSPSLRYTATFFYEGRSAILPATISASRRYSL